MKEICVGTKIINNCKLYIRSISSLVCYIHSNLMGSLR